MCASYRSGSALGWSPTGPRPFQRRRLDLGAVTSARRWAIGGGVTHSSRQRSGSLAELRLCMVMHGGNSGGSRAWQGLSGRASDWGTGPPLPTGVRKGSFTGHSSAWRCLWRAGLSASKPRTADLRRPVGRLPCDDRRMIPIPSPRGRSRPHAGKQKESNPVRPNPALSGHAGGHHTAHELVGLIERDRALSGDPLGLFDDDHEREHWPAPSVPAHQRGVSASLSSVVLVSGGVVWPDLSEVVPSSAGELS